jgi:hypothetical protein
LRRLGDAGWWLTAYTAEPGSPSAEKLGLLANWKATPADQKNSL